MASSTGQLRLASAKKTPSPIAKGASDDVPTPQNLFDSANSRARPVGLGKANGDPSTGALGKADKTMEGRASALRFWNAVATKVKLKRVQDLQPKDVEGPLLENYCYRVGEFSATRPIPYQFKDDLSPPRQDSTRILPFGTIKGYMGGGKNCLREKFPDHPWWPKSNSDNPASFNQLLQDMEPAHERNKARWLQEGFQWGNAACVPMQRDPMPQWDAYPFDVDGEEMRDIGFWYGGGVSAVEPPAPMGCDFSSVMTRRFLSLGVGDYSGWRAWCRDQYVQDTASRGGEIAFLLWSTMYYHIPLQLVSFDRSERKVLNTSKQCVGINPVNPYVCSRFAMGLYIGIGRGLQRQFHEEGTEDVIFFEEHGRSSGAVCKRITDDLKKGLPPNCPPEIVAGTTSRSLRAGAITDMANHPAMGPLEVCARSGHKTGLSMDHYRNPMKVENTVIAAKVMAQHPSVHKPVEEPGPWWLHSPKCKTPFEELLKAYLVGCKVKPFLDGGVLRQDAERLLCIQIMYYNSIKSKHGKCAFVEYMEDLAKSVKLYDPVHLDLTPVMSLEHWSEVLITEFKRRCSTPTDLGVYSIGDLMERMGNVESKLANLGLSQKKDTLHLHDSLKNIALCFQACKDKRIDLLLEAMKQRVAEDLPEAAALETDSS